MRSLWVGGYDAAGRGTALRPRSNSASSPSTKRVTGGSSGTIPVSASKKRASSAQWVLELSLPIFRTDIMSVANECRLPRKVSRAGGEENRECEASGVARAILRSGTTRRTGGREALEDA